MEIRNVGVVGAGTMGAGIAQVAATGGFTVTLVDLGAEQVEQGRVRITKSLDRLVEKGSLGANIRDEALQRLNFSTSLESLAGADLVIEAIIENLAIKRETWARLDQICPPAAIFASNTSSLSITELMIATSATRQTRFIGMHFFNPVPLMGLVEVIHTILTDEESIRVAIRAAEEMGKTVVQATDKTGFIVNRLLVPFILDGIRVLDEGLASITDIDNAVRLGCNHPMGPLTLADFVGLDTTLYIANIMFDEFKERRFAPPAILKRMVQAGLLGRKSGRGFYDYSDPRQPVPFAK
ncbi:MAG: 3-hydroxyacyl-CoA dehydrogenase family protein [Blastocatellia bacterium]|jgi:3-hydroxybutyryl-CoA dehydrogenase